MQIKNMSQSIADSEKGTMSFGVTSADSSAFQASNFSVATASRAPTSPFGSSTALSTGLFSTSDRDVSSPQFFGALGKPASGASGSPSFGAPTMASIASSSSIFGAPSTPVLFGAPFKQASGASSTPSFGAPSKPAFGASGSPSFGGNTVASVASSSPIFGSTPPAFGAPFKQVSRTSSTLSFGAPRKPASGTSGSPFFDAPRPQPGDILHSPLPGASNAPASCTFSCGFLNASISPSLNTPNTPAFGASTSHLADFVSPPKPAFTSSFPSSGASNNQINGFNSTPGYDASSVPFSNSFIASTTPAFGTPGCGASNTPAFGRDFGVFSTTGSNKACPSPLGAANTPVHYLWSTTPDSNASHSPSRPSTGIATPGFAACTTPACCFHNSPFQKQGIQQAEAKELAHSYDEDWHICESISAMLAHKGINMSHEELRWIDYCQRSNKGNSQFSNNSTNVTRIKNIETKSDMKTISINIEMPSGVATQLLDLFKSFHINAQSSSTSPSTWAPASSTPSFPWGESGLF